MKLGLNHLASYLPYGLKCYGMGEATPESEGADDEKPQLFKVEGINSTWVEVSGRLKTVTDEIHIENCIPHLLPLSALAEPMEDGSVPAIKLVELLIEKGIKKDIAPTISFTAKIITKPFGKMLKVTKCDEWYLMLSFDEPERVQHIVFEKLCEWHFDVYGLIDAGLAIDKRTLK